MTINNFKDYIGHMIGSENIDTFFEFFFDNLIVGKSITSLDGKVYVNNAFSKMIGYSKQELEEIKWQDITYLEDVQESSEVVASLINGKADSLNYKKRYIKKDGSLLWADIYVSLFRSPAGDPLFFITTIIDITDKQNYELRLKEREHLFNTFFNSCKDMIFLKDSNFRHLFANDELAHYFKTELSSIIGKTDYELMDEFQADLCRASDMKARESNRPVTVIESIENKVYETRKFGVPLNRDETGVGAYIRDVTNEFNLQKKTERMGVVYRTISEFLTIEFEDSKKQLTFALKEALIQTGSRYGIFYLYNKKERAFELKAITITDTDSAEHLEQTLYKSLDAAGVFQEIFYNMRPIVSEYGIEKVCSDILLSSQEETLIKRYLALPIHRNQELEGIAVLADKTGIYGNEDIQLLSVLMNGVWLSIIKKQEEEQLKALLEQTQSMFNGHEAAMLLIEPISGDIIDANPAAISFYGYLREELLNMNIHDINMLDKAEVDRLRMKAYEKSRKYFTFPHRLKSGEIRSVDVYACPIKYGSREVIFSIIFDVTDREKAQKELIHASYHDHLTGLYNRRYLETQLRDLDKPENYPICIIQADINGLKTVNDVYGYETGDKMLTEAAKHLSAVCDDYHAVVARIGGDEFGIIITKCDEIVRETVIGKLRKKGVAGSSIQFPLSLSIGYQYKYSEDQDIREIFKQAEEYLFKHKIYENSYLRDMSIELVMNALFAKSIREMEHSSRVSDIAEKIAVWMGLSENKYKEIRTAALLHDVGKIGIPEGILNKEGKLNEEEVSIIKKHPEIGWRILGCSPEYRDIAEIILHHHERWDGSGYPYGRCYQDIPLEARIIAVADAFDAMISLRPYRASLSKVQAFEEIRRCSGTQFDPSVVEAFLKPAMAEWI